MNDQQVPKIVEELDSSVKEDESIARDEVHPIESMEKLSIRCCTPLKMLAHFLSPPSSGSGRRLERGPRGVFKW
ncbi:MAG: hypothetical protein ACYSR5_11935, partial [Planctomycetota bacterium]